MQEKFCLSPWKDDCYGDDHFQVSFREPTNKKIVYTQFVSARQTKVLRRPPRFDKQKTSQRKINTSIKQNRQRMQTSKNIYKSSQITPCKKQPLKLSTITNSQNLNLVSLKNKSIQLTKDSHAILLERLSKLKKDGKLNFRQSIGQRILRF